VEPVEDNNVDADAPVERTTRKRRKYLREEELMYALFLKNNASAVGAFHFPPSKLEPTSWADNGGPRQRLFWHGRNRSVETYPKFMQKEDLSGKLLDKSVSVLSEKVLVRFTANGAGVVEELHANKDFVEAFRVSGEWVRFLSF
jgi:hypothetical protein